jgi:hypothetical protein
MSDTREPFTLDASGATEQGRARAAVGLDARKSSSDAIHTAPLPWRHIVGNALVLWLATRLAYLAFTYLAAGMPQLSPAPGTGFLDVWERFDTNWYLGIAQQGYAGAQQLAFFPLYPALIWLFALPLGGNALLAALAVSNLATLVALIGLGALVAHEVDDGEAPVRAMLFLLAFPFAFFLAAAYTEGLFIAIAAFCLLFARQGRWGWAALLTFVAGATRPTGVVLILPLAWEWLRQSGLLERSPWHAAAIRRASTAVRLLLSRAFDALRHRWTGLLALADVPLFLLLFMAFAGLRFGHPMLVFNVHRDYWGIVSAPIWQTAAREIEGVFQVPYASATQVIMILDTLTIIAVAVGTIVFWRSLAGMYNIFMLCLLYLSVAQPSVTNPQVLQSPGRFLLPALPLYFALSAQLRQRPAVRAALICIGFLIQGYVAISFLTGLLVE